jgi:hypothetical protein
VATQVTRDRLAGLFALSAWLPGDVWFWRDRRGISLRLHRLQQLLPGCRGRSRCRLALPPAQVATAKKLQAVQPRRPAVRCFYRGAQLGLALRSTPTTFDGIAQLGKGAL